ncbi:MAG TPA: hypothetical protein ENK73_05480, partial [Thiomicrospira sp.]|nr:hypothetical protein [Thiomicrospira sp.]
MSVLLEALKKAAENKKQSDASGDAVGVQQKEDSISNQDVPSVFSEGLDSSDDKSFSKDNSVEPLPGIRLSSEPDETIIDKPPSIDDLDIPDSAAVESNNLDHHLSTHSNEEILVPVDIVTPEVTNKANLEELPVVTEQGNEVTTPKLSEDETTSKKKKNESDDSFDWSLNQLPGYENNDSIEQTELTPEPLSKGVESNNPILTTNKRFFRSGPTGTLRQVIFGGSSNIAIYLLFSFFTVTVIGFFSIYYFQQQSEQLEQSMRKYKLVR